MKDRDERVGEAFSFPMDQHCLLISISVMTLQDGIESRGEKNGEAGTCKMTSRPIKTSKPNHAPQE